MAVYLSLSGIWKPQVKGFRELTSSACRGGDLASFLSHHPPHTTAALGLSLGPSCPCLIFIYLLYFVWIRVQACMCHGTHVWQSRDNPQELVLSWNLAGSKSSFSSSSLTCWTISPAPSFPFFVRTRVTLDKELSTLKANLSHSKIMGNKI